MVLFAITARVFVPCGGRKSLPRTSIIVQILLGFGWLVGFDSSVYI